VGTKEWMNAKKVISASDRNRTRRSWRVQVKQEEVDWATPADDGILTYMSVHRYRSGSLTDARIIAQVTPGTATVAGAASSLIDISLTDDGAKAALDVFMRDWGWTFVESSPTTPLPSTEAIIGVVSSTTNAFSTAITVFFDTVRKNMDSTVFALTGSGEIQVKQAGTYEVGFNIQADALTGARATSRAWLERNPGGIGSFAAVPDMSAYGYHRNTTDGRGTVCLGAFPVDLTANDLLRVRIEEINTLNLTTRPGSRFVVKKAA